MYVKSRIQEGFSCAHIGCTEKEKREADMTILLADLLSDLREDHRNMAIMLDLLSQQVEHIRDGERPDYELIHDIMRYMTIYSDAVHHPKEDVLYSAMRAE